MISHDTIAISCGHVVLSDAPGKINKPRGEPRPRCAEFASYLRDLIKEENRHLHFRLSARLRCAVSQSYLDTQAPLSEGSCRVDFSPTWLHSCEALLHSFV